MLQTNKKRRKIKMQEKQRMSQSLMELKKMEQKPVETVFLHVVEQETKEVMEKRTVMKNRKKVMKPVVKMMRLIRKS
jgi:hypothetical protein